MVKIIEWEEQTRRQVFKKYSRVIDKVMFKMPDGSITDFYVKSEPDTVCIVGLNSERKVILVKQFRPGPKKVLTELPGGYIDKKETPLQAAHREFLEETGYRGDLHYVGPCLDDAYSSLVRHCFVAENCLKIQSPKTDTNEYVKVELVNLSEFRKLLRSGQMTDIEVGYLALDYLAIL